MHLYVSLDTGIGCLIQLVGKSYETAVVLETGFCPIWH